MTEGATSERIYCPASVDEAYEKLRIGQRVRIQYISENFWTKKATDTRTKGGLRTRRGRILYKNYKGGQSHFTVELEPENHRNKRGRYRLAFNFADILIGAIKVWEVG